ncbi:MAG: 2-hydroxyhepta-2,4-diene-1,7-dioate isomerase [Crocinitomicaceae bacterium]|nr:2-hydroxyhepta-2,4-diene-1,7-dioate isomerase [Crocinitomicaceae bacterium]|tara:strand:+ start:5895 stop:6506 length:612 start_codon:yes stop_codon:yes gene_type:complete
MKIICIGRNYANHAKELNNPIPKEPLFFLKPDSSILPKRNPFYIPNFTNEVHFEVELILKICRLGKNINEKFADTYYNEIGLGIDFTARDIQDQCKKNGHPWEKAKAFDQSAVVSSLFIEKELLDLTKINFRLEKNNRVVQQGNSSDMLFNFNQLISYVSKYMTLKIGDLIFTGTPAGVGKVEIGDELVGYLENKKAFTTRIK